MVCLSTASLAGFISVGSVSRASRAELTFAFAVFELGAVLAGWIVIIDNPSAAEIESKVTALATVCSNCGVS